MTVLYVTVLYIGAGVHGAPDEGVRDRKDQAAHPPQGPPHPRAPRGHYHYQIPHACILLLDGTWYNSVQILDNTPLKRLENAFKTLLTRVCILKEKIKQLIRRKGRLISAHLEVTWRPNPARVYVVIGRDSVQSWT